MKPRTSPQWSLVEAAHLLNRAGFSAPPGQLRAFHSLGPTKAVDSLLAGMPVEKDPLPPPDWANPEAYQTQAREFLSMLMENKRAARRQKAPDTPDMPMMEDKEMQDAGKSGDSKAVGGDKVKREMRKKMRRLALEQGIELSQWWVARMLRGPHPLQEKMTLFWHGHFATSIQKVRNAWFMYQQNAMFRQHALGSFATLTKAVVRDPAMMSYLDLEKSRKQQPNENFARELMELFTLGEGHYTEQDIKESARAFTGLKINRLTGESRFYRYAHDDGPKTFFGKSGNFGPDDIVDSILANDACPAFLARKLWRFFVNDAPSEQDVAVLAKTLREENLHLGNTLRRLFLSEAFYTPPNIRAAIKSPVVFLVQMARQLGLSKLPAPLVLGGCREMGQQLFLPPNVAGWPGGSTWITTNTLFARYNIAGIVARGTDPDYAVLNLKTAGGTNKNRGKNARRKRDWPAPDYAAIAPAALRSNPGELVDQLVFRLFQHQLRPEDRESFLAFARKESEGGLTDTEIGHLVHLMMSTPYYQLT